MALFLVAVKWTNRACTHIVTLTCNRLDLRRVSRCQQRYFNGWISSGSRSRSWHQPCCRLIKFSYGVLGNREMTEHKAACVYRAHRAHRIGGCVAPQPCVPSPTCCQYRSTLQHRFSPLTAISHCPSSVSLLPLFLSLALHLFLYFELLTRRKGDHWNFDRTAAIYRWLFKPRKRIDVRFVSESRSHFVLRSLVRPHRYMNAVTCASSKAGLRFIRRRNRFGNFGGQERRKVQALKILRRIIPTAPRCCCLLRVIEYSLCTHESPDTQKSFGTFAVSSPFTFSTNLESISP